MLPHRRQPRPSGAGGWRTRPAGVFSDRMHTVVEVGVAPVTQYEVLAVARDGAGVRLETAPTNYSAGCA